MEKKDIGLRMALKSKQEKKTAKLPSNFAYKTMQRIADEQRQKERRNDMLIICSIIAVSLSGISAIVYLFGSDMLDAIKRTEMPQDSYSASSIIVISICMIFLLTLNLLLKSKR